MKEEDGKFYHAKTKRKGRLEFKNLELHKSHSFLIIRKALYYYFVHDVEPEQYLKDNRDIFDYCGAVKAIGDWKFVEKKIENQEYSEKDLQKTVRYYISNKGSKLMKCNKLDKRKIQVEAGNWLQTVFNVYEDKPWDDYDINDKYYLEKIYKEIKSLMPERFSNQMNLFD